MVLVLYEYKDILYHTTSSLEVWKFVCSWVFNKGFVRHSWITCEWKQSAYQNWAPWVFLDQNFKFSEIFRSTQKWKILGILNARDGKWGSSKIIFETLVTPGLWTTRVQSEKSSYMLKFQVDSISSKFCSKCRSWERILNFFTSNYWALRKKCAHFLGIRKFFEKLFWKMWLIQLSRFNERLNFQV